MIFLYTGLIGCSEEQETVYESIALEGPVEITAGQFDVADYTVVLTKNDGTTEKVALTKEMVSEQDIAKLSNEGTHEITVTCKGMTVKAQITVKAETQTSAYVSAEVQGPLQIKAGEFDVSEYTVVLTKQDGTTENVTLSLNMMSAEDYNKLGTEGQQTVTVICRGVTANLTVTVVAAVDSEFVFDISENGEYCILKSYKGDGTDVEIPSEYDSKPIKEIGVSAFAGKNYVENITIPESVEKIGAEAFAECKSLQKLVVPLGVKEIGYSAFKDCISLSELTLPFIGQNAEDNETAFLGSLFGAVKYNKNADYVPYALKKIILTSANEIKEGALFGCNGLKEIVLPDNFTSIEKSAFYGCASLSVLHLPSGIKELGKNAFNGCSSLEYIDFENIADFYGLHFESVEANPMCFDIIPSENGVPLGDDIVVPDGVTAINQYAFTDTGVKNSITIPSSVKTVAENALNGNCVFRNVKTEDISAWCGIEFGINNANPLKDAATFLVAGTPVYDLVIPDGVQKIGTAAFINFNALKSVRLPESLTEIGDYAFYGCDKLTIGAFHDSLSVIGGYAFYGCNALRDVTIPASVDTIEERAFATSCVTLRCEAASVPSGWAYAWKNTETPVVWNCLENDIASDGYKYVLYDGMRYILDESNSTATVVSQPTDMEIAVVPWSIECEGKTYNVTKVKEYAFVLNSALTEIHLHSGLEYVSQQAVMQCPAVTVYCQPQSQPSDWHIENDMMTYPVVWDSDNNMTATDGEVYLYLGGVRYALKDGSASVVAQPVSADISCISASINYNNQRYIVTSVQAGAYYGNGALQSVLINGTVKTIGDSAFMGCKILEKVYYLGTADEWQLVTIGAYNDALKQASIYFYSETQPTDDGNYWHLGEDNMTPVIW